MEETGTSRKYQRKGIKGCWPGEANVSEEKVVETQEAIVLEKPGTVPEAEGGSRWCLLFVGTWVSEALA